MNEGTESFAIGESGLASRPRIGTTWAGVADVAQSMSRIVKSVNQEQYPGAGLLYEERRTDVCQWWPMSIRQESCGDWHEGEVH